MRNKAAHIHCHCTCDQWLLCSLQVSQELGYTLMGTLQSCHLPSLVTCQHPSVPTNDDNFPHFIDIRQSSYLAKCHTNNRKQRLR